MKQLTAFISYFALFASFSASAVDGGVEQNQASGYTRAAACDRALSSAEFAANLKSGTPNGASVTKKKCECEENKKDSPNSPVRWSCVGFVSWEKSK